MEREYTKGGTDYRTGSVIKKSTRLQPELFLRIKRRSGVPLTTQLEQELRSAIREGHIKANQQLPSTRTLAEDLEVSRGVVVAAYEQLLAEGYLISRQSSATFVSEHFLPTSLIAPKETRNVFYRFDFRPGLPDPSLFPRRAWLSCLRRTMDMLPASALDYPDPRGSEPLRLALASYLNRARRTVAEPRNVVVCTGFAQGLRLICKILVRRGIKNVVVEDPWHVQQRATVQSLGLETIAVPVDERGLRTDLIQNTQAGAVIVTPAHQFPTGAVLAPERRHALLEWAANNKGLVIEDDYDAEFRYDREPIGSLQGLSPLNVVYCGSASKILSPALRLGWMVVPAELATAVSAEKREEDLGCPAIEQLTFADFVARGDLDQHLRRSRNVYRARRNKLVRMLERQSPFVRTYGVAAGLHVMIELAREYNETKIVEAASRESIRIVGVQSYRAKKRGPPALLLGFGAITDVKIKTGLDKLMEIIARLR